MEFMNEKPKARREEPTYCCWQHNKQQAENNEGKTAEHSKLARLLLLLV